jgi:hypothetical protein
MSLQRRATGRGPRPLPIRKSKHVKNSCGNPVECRLANQHKVGRLTLGFVIVLTYCLNIGIIFWSP